MRGRLSWMIVLVSLLLSSAARAGIDLNYFRSTSIDWVSCPVDIDSLVVQTNVNAGVAQTEMTLVLTPQVPSYKISEGVDQIDSLEITTSMYGLTGFAMQELYLWVNGEAQRGYIQDKWLAQDQYQTIVGRRLDPALLSTWGGGSYSLRIFPAQTGKSRKLSIQFQHSFRDSAESIWANLPFSFGQGYYYYEGVPKLKFASFELSATDTKSYSFEMEGIGSGTFTHSKPLTLTASDIFKLGNGIIRAADPSGSDVYAWRGKDLVDNRHVTGFEIPVNEKTVVLEPEPQTRVLLLDAQNEFWSQKDYYEQLYRVRNYSYSYYDYYYGWQKDSINLVQRIKKLAVVALKSYVADGQLFNIVTDETGPLFTSAVAPTESNLNRAFEAIARFKVSRTPALVRKVDKAVKSSSGGIVVLLSDAFEPFDYYDSSYSVTSSGQKYNTMIDSVDSIITQSEVTLFTITDCYRLRDIAYRSGGSYLNGLRYYYYYSEGTEIKVTSLLPDLYSNNYGITGLRVETDAEFSDMTYSIDDAYYYPRIMILRSPMLMKGAAVYPYYYSNDALLRITAKAHGGTVPQKFTCTVRGKMKGRAFTKECVVVPDKSPVFLESGSNVLWALSKTENFNGDDYQAFYDTSKQIGLKYHIVTPMTSLLALEPGMELWIDSSAREEKAGAASMMSTDAVRASTTSDTYSYSVFDIDQIALEDLVADEAVDVADARVQSVRTHDVKVKAIAQGMELFLPSEISGKKVELKLFDLSGRLVAARTLSGTETLGSKVVWNLAKIASNRYYVVKIKSESYQKAHKVLWVR